MSRVRANTVTNFAGTGTPSLPYGIQVGTGATVSGSTNTINLSTKSVNRLIIGTGGSGNSVGIRTTFNMVTNSEVLAVRGTSSFKSVSETRPAIYLGNEGAVDDTPNPLLLFNQGGTNVGGIGYVPNTGELRFNNQYFITFNTGTSTLAGTERVRITATGDVEVGQPTGIGITLSPNGTSSFTNSGTVVIFNGNGIEVNNSIGSNVFVGTQDGSDGKMGTRNNANFSLFTNNIFAKRVTLDTSGNFSLADGNLEVASGHGIDFSATGQGTGTMSSELLDDYEEGTWTPTFAGETTAGTYTYGSQVGTYVKVGRMVTANFRLQNIATSSAGTGTANIKGFPFSATFGGGTGQTGGNLRMDSFNLSATAVNLALNVGNGESFTSIYVTQDDTGDAAVQVTAKSTDAADIIGQMTYFTAS